MNRLPNDEEIRALHEKYAPSRDAFELVYTHCEVIWEIAMQCMQKKKLDVDKGVVRVGCLLHDIGAYRVFENGHFTSNYIQHGVLGETLLRQEDLPPVIWRIASHHTGIGLSKEEIVNDELPLPHQDYFAETPEERLIMYADKFHSKTVPPQFNSVQWYAQYVEKFGDAKRHAFLDMVDEFGEPDLKILAKKYGISIR